MFTWRDGTATADPQELVALADRYWDEAQRYLANGDWERWFRQLHRNDLAQAAEQARAGQGGHLSAALEDFLHALDPQLQQPELRVSPLVADLGLYDLNASPQSDGTVEIEVAPLGRGCVYGAVEPADAWLVVEPRYVEAVPGRPIRVRVSAERSALGWGRKLVGTFEVRTNGGSTQVPCTVRTPAIWTNADFWLRLAGFRGGAMGFVWGALLGAPCSLVAHWPVFLLMGLVLPGFDAWRAGVAPYLLAWCLLAGGLLGGVTLAWRSEWAGMLNRSDDSFGVEKHNLWLAGLYGGAASALAVGSVYVVMAAGLLLWLGIALAHFAYVGFLVTLPLMLVGAAAGALFAGLIALVRWLMWQGLRSLLLLLARMS